MFLSHHYWPTAIQFSIKNYIYRKFRFLNMAHKHIEPFSLIPQWYASIFIPRKKINVTKFAYFVNFLIRNIISLNRIILQSFGTGIFVLMFATYSIYLMIFQTSIMTIFFFLQQVQRIWTFKHMRNYSTSFLP